MSQRRVFSSVFPRITHRLNDGFIIPTGPHIENTFGVQDFYASSPSELRAPAYLETFPPSTYRWWCRLDDRGLGENGSWVLPKILYWLGVKPRYRDLEYSVFYGFWTHYGTLPSPGKGDMQSSFTYIHNRFQLSRSQRPSIPFPNACRDNPTILSKWIWPKSGVMAISEVRTSR